MTIKQDILAALRGQAPLRVPWNIHHLLLGRGDYEREMRNARLGLIHKATFAFQTVQPHVSVEERQAWENGAKAFYITHHTPLGDLHSKKIVGPDGSVWRREYPVKGLADLSILRLIVEDTAYYPNYDAILAAQRVLGEDGIVLSRMPYSPFQRLLIQWMGVEALSFGLADYPEEIDRLLECMAAADETAQQITAGSPAEVVWGSENITATISSPRLFNRYCAPYYNHFAELLHAQGKLYGLHMDGLLAALKDAIADIQVDFVEGFTPPPMGDLSLAEALSAWPGKAIWVNFPGSVLACSDDAVIEYTLELLRTGMASGRFLLGFTEDMPDVEHGLRLVRQGIARYEGMHMHLDTSSDEEHKSD